MTEEARVSVRGGAGGRVAREGVGASRGAAMTAYREVRSLQAWLRRDKKRYRSASDPLFTKRGLIQRANEFTFCNPSPGSDDDARERWAQRWLANFYTG